MLEFSLIAGILFGLFFALVGMGLNLVFGVMRIVNLAHGDFMMLGAFGAFWAYNLLGWNPLVTIPVQGLAFVLAGMALYYLLVPRLVALKDFEMISLVLFFGLSQTIEALAVLAFGNNPRSIFQPVFGQAPVHFLGRTFPVAWPVSAAVSLFFLILVYFYLYRTRAGYATRAVMASRDEASASGVNVDRISALTFGLGLLLASVAGMLSLFMLGSVSPDFGGNITITAFAVIVFGGLGDPVGTVLGGLLYGIGLMVMESYLSSWANILPYVLLLATLLVKPGGIMGKEVRHV
ncbi:MAG: branched-chain amino acid ABC transporter permease [Peptococcaceae bacterium]|jgi:branched-chain amino acid transport system permease protein|nr:branched-chain amino acid ABC transporter permease [Peptococcaceae bacterium]